MDKRTDLPRFDFALSLAGAVSGGAYIAGALDFIIEALDEFERARDAGESLAPAHALRLCAVSGASSGSLTAATLASIVRKRVIPIREPLSDGVAAHNPLYDSWVNQTGLRDLLACSDAGAVQSLFDGGQLDRVAARMFALSATLPVQHRGWLADPLRFAFTLSNLRGVPYSMATPACAGELELVLHQDQMRFCVNHAHGVQAAAPWPDERPVQASQPGDFGWSLLRDAALASAAFPVLLRARSLRRPTEDYLLPSGSPGRPPLRPTWSSVNSDPGPTYSFLASDGGIFRNSPVALAADALQRSLSNSGSGAGAEPAVLIIDPLAHPHRPGPARAGDWASLLGGLAQALLEQARTPMSELQRAGDPRDLGRFLLTPLRGANINQVTERGLAGDFLGAFGGYLGRAFRRHDFLLGRCHAQRFLAEQFSLPSTHALFSHWTADQREHFRIAQTDELPIIPLMSTLHPRHGHALPAPSWPKGMAELDDLDALLTARLNCLFLQFGPKTGWLRWLARVLWPMVRGQIRRRLVKQLHRALQEHQLAAS